MFKGNCILGLNFSFHLLGRTPFTCNPQEHQVMSTKADYINNMTVQAVEIGGSLLMLGALYVIPRKYAFAISESFCGIAFVLMAISQRPEYLQTRW